MSVSSTHGAAHRGHRANAPHLMVRLLYLQHIFVLSDKDVVVAMDGESLLAIVLWRGQGSVRKAMPAMPYSAALRMILMKLRLLLILILVQLFWPPTNDEKIPSG